MYAVAMCKHLLGYYCILYLLLSNFAHETRNLGGEIVAANCTKSLNNGRINEHVIYSRKKFNCICRLQSEWYRNNQDENGQCMGEVRTGE